MPIRSARGGNLKCPKLKKGRASSVMSIQVYKSIDITNDPDGPISHKENSRIILKIRTEIDE